MVFASLMRGIEGAVSQKVSSLKRKVMLAGVEFLLYSLSIVFLAVGSVLFISRFFPLDLVLLVAGTILLYVGLLTRRLR
ncbi:hypothetical protein HYU18_00265 [Candidatus Woesearchaeota archaeon]|nr:hypothetical protein [Candidatus Woesearchaeota archaeon]